ERRVELAPELIGAEQQRDVRRMLVVGEANNPRLAVHGAVLVRDLELLEPDDAAAAAREVVQRGAAHRADAHHHGVVAPAHAWRRSSRSTLSSTRRSTSPRSTFEFVIPYAQRHSSWFTISPSATPSTRSRSALSGR